MPPRKKSTSSTESSSASSSDSSSSDSSSSNSDSGSSSSESDSSSSQEAPTTRTSNNSSNANANEKVIRRRNSETVGSASKALVAAATAAAKDTDKSGAVKTGNPKHHKGSKPSVSSSDEDSSAENKPAPPPIVQKKVQQAEAAKRRAQEKQAAVHGNIPQAIVPPITGGKVPPSVIKQQQQQQQHQHAQAKQVPITKAAAKASLAAKEPPPPPKLNPPIAKKGPSPALTATATKAKKKSIFSPVNSSESDDDKEKVDQKDRRTSSSSSIGVTMGGSAGGGGGSHANKDQITSAGKTTNANATQQQRTRGRPRKTPLVKPQVNTTGPVTKPVAQVKPQVTASPVKAQPSSNNTPQKPTKQEDGSSATSTSTDSSSSGSSDSDSDSSEDSSPSAAAAQQLKKSNSTMKRPLERTPQKVDGKEGGTESEGETGKQTRKLTRSSSTRKSKHLLGKNASETESDAESVKRSASKSPVKKAPIIPTKGKAKNSSKKKDAVIKEAQMEEPEPVENRCPLIHCATTGHLGGQFERHFILEACPMYHNMTSQQTTEFLLERKRKEEERKKAMPVYENSKKIQTPEQKNYLQKIRDMRVRFKPNPPPVGKPRPMAERDENEIDLEPMLEGIVPDYDLQLFREAQAAASESMETELKEMVTGKGTRFISMGRHCMQVWYQSPYPDDVARLPKLYLCEFCLRYQKSEVGMKRHATKCVWRHPPGDEIYRKGKLGVWQVDGKRHKQYCQNLCLLAKFFLDHKTLYYDVEPFLFYVMTLADSDGCHTVGYFSKEKNSFLNYNVSCILTLPPYQRKGYGRLLIDFSYLLTRVEGKIGSPEKPLSDLGLISYRSYWKDVLLAYLCSRPGTTLSIKDISQEMAINSYDIVSTLQALGMMKYWKGKHIILKKQDVLEEYEERVKRRGNIPKIDPSCLKWTPFVAPTPTTPTS
ncbi:histone acetyltransferase KAT7 isoform X2 [Topomyia yanbarensis]|uniref:histone acetyltransferase KAT7 isoform X2 n=1 Tax=Topomyia yanbarensis TaxID=2498891 RepID=UPI00273CE71E|nr:histone acetyltransferase KAT7 isoform X2 [Topomyia yanbarensis]